MPDFFPALGATDFSHSFDWLIWNFVTRGAGLLASKQDEQRLKRLGFAGYFREPIRTRTLASQVEACSK